MKIPISSPFDEELLVILLMETKNDINKNLINNKYDNNMIIINHFFK